LQNHFSEIPTMSTAREQLITTTWELLEAQGYHGTGLNQIVAASGAPKGSLYYYFPAGKEQLAATAIEHVGALTAERIAAGLALEANVATSVRRFAELVAAQVERSGFRAGGPLTTVAMETATSSATLNQACRAAYARLQEGFAAKLRAGGYAEARAEQLAGFILAAMEGAIILSRTRHSGDPLRLVGAELGRFLSMETP
jgi:TetR/AcrR family transcriptional repressor of lmrAB and yxaGH operons